MEAVHRYEGTVNQVMGDGIMALFGAPLAHEDHAVRACYAALRMQEAVKRYAEGVRRSDGLPSRSASASTRARSWCARSATTCAWTTRRSARPRHLAARMEQMAAPGTILVTAATLRLAEGYVAVKPLGPRRRSRASTTPLEVYELTGAGPARTRLQRGGPTRAYRFVGREAELAQLRRAQLLPSRRTRPGSRHRRRGRRGQVAPGLRVHPFA